MTDRFIEFETQNTDNGEINTGFNDISNGEWYYTKDSENAKKICRILNNLYEDNIRVKQLITEAYNNERTQIGRNTLKQLLEQI